MYQISTIKYIATQSKSEIRMRKYSIWNKISTTKYVSIEIGEEYYAIDHLEILSVEQGVVCRRNIARYNNREYFVE